jgi:hypothetical protein
MPKKSIPVLIEYAPTRNWTPEGRSIVYGYFIRFQNGDEGYFTSNTLSEQGTGLKFQLNQEREYDQMRTKDGKLRTDRESGLPVFDTVRPANTQGGGQRSGGGKSFTTFPKLPEEIALDLAKSAMCQAMTLALAKPELKVGEETLSETIERLSKHISEITLAHAADMVDAVKSYQAQFKANDAPQA